MNDLVRPSRSPTARSAVGTSANTAASMRLWLPALDESRLAGWASVSVRTPCLTEHTARMAPVWWAEALSVISPRASRSAGNSSTLCRARTTGATGVSAADSSDSLKRRSSFLASGAPALLALESSDSVRCAVVTTCTPVLNADSKVPRTLCCRDGDGGGCLRVLDIPYGLDCFSNPDKDKTHSYNKHLVHERWLDDTNLLLFVRIMMRMNSKSSVFDIFSSESWSKKASRKKFRQQEVMSPLIDETVCLEGASHEDTKLNNGKKSHGMC